MGAWSRLPALLVVWCCLCTCTLQLSVLDKLQAAAIGAPSGGDLSRQRRSRHGHRHRHGGLGRFLEAVTTPPAFETVGEFDSVMVQCEFKGSPPPSIDWLKDGHMLRKAGLTESAEEQTNSLDSLLEPALDAIVLTRARLYLDCMSPRDQGVYTCQGQTAYASKSVSTTLFVDKPASAEGMSMCERHKHMQVRPARIVQWRKQILSKSGGTIRLVCETTGYPAPAVTWHKMANRGLESHRLITNDDPRVTIMPNGDLIIDPLEWSDMGNYQCQASNEFGADHVKTFLYPYKPSD